MPFQLCEKALLNVLIQDFYVYGANDDVEEYFRMKSAFYIGDDLGSVSSYTEMAARVFCPMEFAAFPMDRHECEFRVGSQMFDTEDMLFESTTDDREFKLTALPFDVRISNSTEMILVGWLTLLPALKER